MSQSVIETTPNNREDDAAIYSDVERQAEEDTDFLRDDGNQNRLRRQRIFGRLRQLRSNGETFPSKKTSTAHGADSLVRKQAKDLRIQAIELLFGLPADHASEWPGILVFCHHLENCFEVLLDPQFDIIWMILHRDSPSATVDCWHWCFAVIKAFQALQDDDASIEKAYQRLIEDAKKPLHDIKAPEKIQVLRAMFAVLCWTSATLKPLLDDKVAVPTTDVANLGLAQNTFSLAAENTSQKYCSKDVRRPISKMFYSFRNHAEEVEELEHRPVSGSIQSSNDVLYESSLNYFSLFTIGRVRLKWVDTLTAHLAFDRSTRTLSVFGFPSFCVSNVLRKHDVKVLQSITAKLLHSHYGTDSPLEPSALYREVLLSYRLLFGQSSSSRKLLRQLLSQSSSSTGAAVKIHRSHRTAKHHCHSGPSDDLFIDDIDPFLPTICTSPLTSCWRRLSFTRQEKPSHLPNTIFPFSTLDLDDRFQESDTYSAREDFTVFGPRLLILQNYNMRQQPSKMKDLWRDRRNPLQWYTFWAVLWIGGATIVLAVLQLLVGVAQMYLAVRMLP